MSNEINPIKQGKPAIPQVIEIFERKGEGVGLRLGAVFFDAIIIYAIAAVISATIAAMIATLSGAFSQDIFRSEFTQFFLGTAVFIIPITWFVYFTVMEGAFGTTAGKILGVYPMRFGVITKNGGKIGFGRAALRALIGFFETNPIGAIVIAATPFKQRLGDLAAGTLVVDKTKIRSVEFKTDYAVFEFVDGHVEELVRVSKGVITKWLGIPQWMTVHGVNRQGHPLRIRAKIVRGATVFFNEPKMGQLRLGLENTFKFHFTEVLEWWRIVVIVLALSFLLCAFAFLLVILPTIANSHYQY